MKPKLLACLPALLASGLGMAPLQAQTPYPITVKAGPLRQTFAGFGASQASTTWSNIAAAPRNAMADMVYRDLKMNVLRLWVTTKDTLTVADMLAEFNTKYVASYAISDITSRGVTTLLLAPAGGGGAPVPASIPTYADHLAELILQIKTTYGITIQVTGISNEPEAMWSTANLIDCINALRAGLDARGLSGVKIIAPESSNPYSAAASVKAIHANSSAWNNLYAIASHSYGAVLPNDDLESLKLDKPWWITEASDDGNELAEDENRAASIVSRYLCEMNHGVNEWVFFIGLGQVSDNSTYQIGTAFLMVYDLKTASIVPFLKYHYFKQALNTFDVACVFRKCVSASEGDMFASSTNGVTQNPAINAAAAYNPDGSWGINIANDTGITGSPAYASNAFYPAASYSVTLTVDELANTPGTSFTVYRSRANNHFVASGTLALVNGVGAVDIAPKELVSLRSAPTAPAIAPAPDGLSASTINAPVALVWNNTTKATSWHVKRATTSGGPYTTLATTATTGYDDHSALNGSVYYYVVAAVNAAGESANSAEVIASPAPFPWINADIGAVGPAGSCAVSASGSFTTYGAGSNLCSTADAFNFTYQTLTGDGTFIARMASVSRANSLVGILMSETLGTSPKAASVIYNNNGAWLKAMMGTRTTAGATGSWTHSTITAVPTWLKLVRAGNTFTGSASPDGITWTTIASSTIAMNRTIYVGLVNCLNNSLCKAIFDHVTAPCAAPTGALATTAPGQVKLRWTACYGAASYAIKRAGASGGPYTTLATVTSPALSYSDTTIATATSYYYVVSALNAMGESANSAESSATVAPSWSNVDIGAVGLAGSYAVANNGTFTTYGAGGNLGTAAGDSFNFTYQTLAGDGTFIARMTSINRPNARAGILMSETLGTSPKAACVVYNNNGVWLKAMMGTRATAGAGASWAISEVTAVPSWLKLVRAGNTFTGYASADGNTWSTINSGTIAMTGTIYVGLVNCYTTTTTPCTATFDHVTGAPIIVTSAAPTAGGTTTGGGAFAVGDSVTLTATANSGYLFSNWAEGLTSVSNSSTYPFSYAGPRQLAANFQPTPWTAWQTGRFSAAELLDPAVHGALQAPDHDGICNLLKYAFRLERQHPDLSQLPKVAAVGDSFSLTYVRNPQATDLTYVVEVSSDLQTWNSGANFTTAPVLIRDDSLTQTLQVSALPPPAGAAARYVRLRVTGP